MLKRQSPLGRQSAYIDTYDRSLLFPILRQPKREAIGIGTLLPFTGYDVWTAYELSWLNAKGKPMVALADIIVACESPCIIESKSFKLYLNSFNNTQFDSPAIVRETLLRDLSQAAGAAVDVTLFFASDYTHRVIRQFEAPKPPSGSEHQITIQAPSSAPTPSRGQALRAPSPPPRGEGDIEKGSYSEGFCLDDLDVVCTDYTVNLDLLQVSAERVKNSQVYSHLLKSNCLVTGQPDWGSIQITYSGFRIDEASLLQYLVSYRNHNEFHEQCVERIFMDIKTRCQPDELTVYARYTRRGGLDINPIRSTNSLKPPANERLFRQ